jgi:VIT1/CCC1 family predicted Fe2+/Mn2+ transporter
MHSKLLVVSPDSLPPATAVRSINKRVLDPGERIAEVLFGLIMALTFTGSLSIAEVGRDDIRTMLIGALGCNIAWGIIDAIFYLMGSFAERTRNLGIYRAVRRAADPAEGRRLIAEAMPAVVASALVPEELERARKRLQGLPEPSEHALTGSDWRGAGGVFLLVFLSTFPVSVPFLVMHNVAAAMRVSNGVAVVMLFVAGAAYGRLVGRSPLAFGISMVVLGSVLVALTIALGG